MLKFKSSAALQLLFSFCLVRAHGGHGDLPLEKKDGSASAQYAQRHMATEHHIDSFDPQSFFYLHDLNSDGILDADEVQAIYGVHHPIAQKQSPDEAVHQEKADRIVEIVMNIFDKNRDGKISVEEFVAAGLGALPSFETLGAEGHHYDAESEFFLHHEEQFHSTPETQTDESYVHPEDIEHFAQHEAIERQEAIKEAEYQGISVEEALAEHDHGMEAESEAPPPSPDDEVPQAEDGQPELEVVDPLAPGHVVQEGEQVPIQEEPIPLRPKIQRQTPPEKQEPQVKYRNAKEESNRHAEWGTGEEGYKIPTTPGERMRKNVPYKYKFRRNWGDF